MGTLRVISGSARGCRLKTVPGDTTRPITDQVKESLFNIIGQQVEDVLFLDLFGGTGAVGIEALSRGAKFTTFLDNNYRAFSIIKENLQITRLEEYAEVFKRDVFDFLQNAPHIKYDYIYVAPPQYKKMWEKAMQILDANPDWLADNGEIIVQINPLEWQENIYTNVTIVDQRRYGDTMLIFFCKTQAKEIIS